MEREPIDYQALVLTALRDVPRQVLRLAADAQHSGEHHLYLTFHTAAPGVELPRFLRDQYPDEMTIVLQNQYWNLQVEDESFAVDLQFGGRKVTLVVPFASLARFADADAGFELRFDARPMAAEEAPAAPEPAAAAKPPAASPSSSEVLRFDPSRRR